jgi:hypothetical protein
MSKLRNFVRRESDFMAPERTRRDYVLNAVTISLCCLIIAGVLRGLFEIWQRVHP